jgi:hypothetical protein
MTKTKIIIMLDGGTVSEVFSEVEAEYVVIDKDMLQIGQFVIDPSQDAHTMPHLTLTKFAEQIEDDDIVKALKTRASKKHDWI